MIDDKVLDALIERLDGYEAAAALYELRAERDALREEMVPMEPTQEMKDAGRHAYVFGSEEVWRAMYAAGRKARHEAKSDALRQDAERYRWLRENNAWIVECLTQRRGYRSTESDAPWEVWDEHEGWIVSTMSSDVDPYPTMDAAIDAVRGKA